MTRPTRARALVAAALLVGLVVQLLAIARTNVHWDEFALLHLVDRSHASGRIESGGRAGLAVVALLPFVADCDDEIAVIRRARLLWLGLTVLWLVGLGVWIAQLAPGRPGRWRDAAFGVALLALVPAFLDSSVQVRTDHLALVGGCWGGAALLASRRRPALALVAGVCLGLGFLGSQKVAYLAALAGLLTLADLVLHPGPALRREALRGLLVVAGALGTTVGFRLAVDAAFVVPEVSRVRTPMDRSYLEHGLSLFDYYRNTIGWSQYGEMLPSLVPHAVLLAALAAASVASARRRRADRPRLLLAWAVLALGLAVALFHAAAFHYFWLTLGIFPAVAFALARESLVALAPSAERGRLAVVFCLVLAAPAVLHLALRSGDSQAVQRESLRFVHRNFSREATGFHPESGLFCQAGAQPFPTFFSQHLYRNFAGAAREQETRRLLGRFRKQPVEFVVQSFRLNQFPVEVRRFWADNYQPYFASVFVAGRRLEGARGDVRDFELIVPGRYRWLPRGGPRRVTIGDRLVEPGGLVELTSGAHRAHFVEDVDDGLLVLALAEPPGEAPLPFYEKP